MIGHTAFNIKNLQSALNHMQANPQSFKEGIMGLALLQGLAKQEKDQTISFVLEATPDGKILLNGRDFAPIMQVMKQSKASQIQAPPVQ